MSWMKKWEGPEDPMHYLRALVAKTMAIEEWVEKNERRTLLNETLDLSELFHPDTFLNAFRQQTARYSSYWFFFKKNFITIYYIRDTLSYLHQDLKNRTPELLSHQRPYATLPYTRVKITYHNYLYSWRMLLNFRELKCSMDSLKFACSWKGGISGASKTIKLGGLQLEGCSFDGQKLSENQRDSPSISAVPPCVVAWIPQVSILGMKYSNCENGYFCCFSFQY